MNNNLACIEVVSLLHYLLASRNKIQKKREKQEDNKSYDKVMINFLFSNSYQLIRIVAILLFYSIREQF